MASYVKEKNGTYTIRYRIKGEGGATIHKAVRGFERKRDAKEHYEEVVLPELLIEQDSESPEPQLLQTIYVHYLIKCQSTMKESTIDLIKRTANAYILPDFGEANIFEITSLDLVNWQNGLEAKGFSFRYKSFIRYVFFNIFKFAKHYGIKTNPFVDVEGFSRKAQKRTMDIWEPKTFQAFMSAITNLQDKLSFSALYLSGARKGEWLAVAWEDIDFTRGGFWVRKTYSRKTSGGKNYVITSPKTESSHRFLDMPPSWLELARTLLAEQQKIEDFSPQWFVSGGLHPMPENTLMNRKNAYCKKAEVQQIRLHDFRHSHASHLISQGFSVVAIANRLGHSSTEQTFKTYLHLFPSENERIRSVLNISF